MSKQVYLVFPFLFCLVGCQLFRPFLGQQEERPIKVHATKPLKIAGFPFKINIGSELNSHWHGVEIVPAELPYKGEIANLSVEDRWTKIFTALVDEVAVECRKGPVDLVFGKDLSVDYAALGNSVEHPKYGKVAFTCK